MTAFDARSPDRRNPAADPRPGDRWTRGTSTLAVDVRALGAVKSAVRADPDLGRLPDKALAVRHGCTRQHVSRIRALAGIARVPQPAPKQEVAAAHPDFGALSDAALAAAAGVASATVSKARRRHGITRSRPRPGRAAVLAAMLDGHTKARPIWRASGIRQEPSVYRILRELCAEGVIVRVSAGVYVLAPPRVVGP